MGYDVINVRYTRDKNVAHTLNEMLLHLLRVKPKDPVASLVGFLESAEGHNAIAVTKAKGKRQKLADDISQGAAADATKPQTRAEATQAIPAGQPFARGDGVACLARSSPACATLDGILRAQDAPAYGYRRGSGVAALNSSQPRSGSFMEAMEANIRDGGQAAPQRKQHEYRRGSGVAALNSSQPRSGSFMEAMGNDMQGNGHAAPHQQQHHHHEYRRGSGVAALNSSQPRSGSFMEALENGMTAPPQQQKQHDYRRGSGVAALNSSQPRSGSFMEAMGNDMQGNGHAAQQHHEYRRGSGVAALNQSAPRSGSLVALQGTLEPPHGDTTTTTTTTAPYEYRRGSGVAALETTASQNVSFIGSLQGGLQDGHMQPPDKKASVSLLCEMDGTHAANRSGSFTALHMLECSSSGNPKMLRSLSQTGACAFVEYHSDVVSSEGYVVWGTGIELLRSEGGKCVDALVQSVAYGHPGLSILEQTSHSGHRAVRSLSISAVPAECGTPGLWMLSNLNASTSAMLLSSAGTDMPGDVC